MPRKDRIRMLHLAMLLLAPTAAAMLALPFGMRVRAPTGGRQMRALYLFHRNGEPIAIVAPDHAPPIAAERLETIIGTVRDLVETSVPETQGYDVTSMRFEEEALVAIRGAHVSVCAVFRGTDVASIRRDLVRFIREFEGAKRRRVAHLGRRMPVCAGCGRCHVPAPCAGVIDLTAGRGPSADGALRFTCPARGTP